MREAGEGISGPLPLKRKQTPPSVTYRPPLAWTDTTGGKQWGARSDSNEKVTWPSGSTPREAQEGHGELASPAHRAVSSSANMVNMIAGPKNNLGGPRQSTMQHRNPDS